MLFSRPDRQNCVLFLNGSGYSIKYITGSQLVGRNPLLDHGSVQMCHEQLVTKTII